MAMHEVRVKVVLSSTREASAVYRSLKPEVLSRMRGVTASVELSGNKVIVTVASKDLKKAAAVTNSLLNLARLSLEIQRAMRNGGVTSVH